LSGHNEQFDLLIVDIDLKDPDHNGIDFVKRYKVFKPETKVIIYTGQDINNSIKKQLSGIYYQKLIKKPFEWKSFAEKIKNVCNYTEPQPDNCDEISKLEDIIHTLQIDCARNQEKLKNMDKIELKIDRLDEKVDKKTNLQNIVVGFVGLVIALLQVVGMFN